ncbi:MAG: hypothetical protein HY246_04400 [Proteobacteria bacterium]|nr:hypothetical protein [Pseudomonadota bacterium]
MFVYDGYWALVSAPHMFPTDRYLRERTGPDSWYVDRPRVPHYAAGQLAVIRVGIDKRRKAELDGHPRLKPGLYALCEITSGAQYEGAERPWIGVRVLRSYLERPLLVATLRHVAPDLFPPLLRGVQASTFPIPRGDFRRLLDLLGEDEAALRRA